MRVSPPAALLLASTALPSALAGLQELWYNITYVADANPDGLFPRRVIGVNGTWPPPIVSINTTDDLLVHAHNALDAPTTLHHHGMFFNASAWFDGALGVTQCGIPPGATFDYRVPVSTSGQWGTYWWHAHSSGQYVDGLRAPLLLHPSGGEHYKYDGEYVVVLGDWYHAEHGPLLAQFINIANPGGAEPVPDSALIYFAHPNGTYIGPSIGEDGQTLAGVGGVGFNENTTLAFEPGKTYRLRVINTSAFAAIYFWIDGHEMRIIEADGTDTEESPTDVLSLTVAQRYSVLVTARNDASSNWAVHANMDTDMFDTVPEALNPNITSTITYNASAPLAGPYTLSLYHDVDDLALVPVLPQPLQPATRTLTLEATFATMDDGTNHAMFNGITYNAPLVPAVLSELTLGANASVEAAYGPLSFVVGAGEVVDVVIQNGDAGKHPFHLHGHKPQLVARATDYTSSDPALNPPVNESQVNPMRRDTVQVESGTSATLRVVADNPGVWFLHCHIEWHLQVGLAVQLIEAPLHAQSLAPNLPPALAQHCAAQALPTAGNAAGHASTTDLSGLRLGPFPQRLGWHGRGIGAMSGCVLSAVLGMGSVVWYALGGGISDAEVEEETRRKLEERERRGRWGGLGRARGA